MIQPPQLPQRSGKVSSWLLLAAIIVALAALIFLRGRSAPAPEYFDKSLTLTSAKAKSAESGKPIVALATADWCPPCKSLKRNALVDPRVVAFMKDKVVPVYLDATNSMPTDAEYLNVYSIPTVIVIKNGNEVARFSGEQPADEVLAFLEQSVK